MISPSHPLILGERPVIPRQIDASHGPILYLEDVTVSFDGFRALDGLSLTVDNGELRCLIGPNGAGKTTLLDVITGRTRPQAGSVYFGQTIDLTRLSEAKIAQAGIGRKFQKPSVFPEHSVWDNLYLALRAERRIWTTLRARPTPEQTECLEAILETVGLTAVRQRRAATLAHGQKQWLEIGMLLAQDPLVMLLDEPVAGMTHEEVERTARLLVSLAGDRTLLVVEHDMDFVRTIAGRVTVLHEGRVLAEGPLKKIQSDPHVAEVYLGEQSA